MNINFLRNIKRIGSYLSKYPYILLILTSLILTISWFLNAKMIASGEESFFLYNPGISFKLFSSPWYEVVTGMPMPVLLPRISLLAVPYILTDIFLLPPWTGQAVVLFFILCSGLLGMYFLSKNLLMKKFDELIFLAISFFYLFNLYTLSQIFGRLLFTGILLWAYLPIFIFLFTLWIEKRKVLLLLLFAFSSLLFSYVYGMPSNVIVLWVAPLVWTLLSIITTKKKLSMLVSGVMAILAWALVNIWWIFPYLVLSHSAFNSVANSSESINSLIGVSAYFPSSQIIILKQLFLFQSAYHGWYNDWGSLSISITIFLTVCYGIVRSDKTKNWLFLMLLLAIGWFVSKGTNPPFGLEFYSFIFKHFPMLQVFRNSYEKFGIIWVFPYSFFFGLGLNRVVRDIRVLNRYRLLFTFLLIIIFCFFFVWPILTGEVFGADISNTRIKVPQYYNDANTYINSLGEGKILMLPMINGDGIKYDWRGGDYQGIEPSELLFAHPSISKIVRLDLIDKEYNRLYEAIIHQNSYSKLLDQLNIRYIVLHRDIDTKAMGASASSSMKELISTNIHIKYLRTFGLLDIYEYNTKQSRSLFDLKSQANIMFGYKQISTTHYIVQITNATTPYTVILKETYNPLWIARINNVIVTKHFIAYGYANGWKIDKAGSYTIDIQLKIWPWE